MFTPDNPHYSLGERLVCVSETRSGERITLVVRAAAGGGSFASVWAVTPELGPEASPARLRLLAARTAWAPNHWMTDHGSDLRRLDRYRDIVALTRPADPLRAIVAGSDEVIPGLVTHFGLYVSAHDGRGQDVYVALMPYFPHTVAQLVGARGETVSTRVDGQVFTAAARPHGFPPAVGAGHAAVIARGICALHDREMIHRDISCDNTLVRADGTVVVGDLNLAALLTHGHYRGSLDRGKGFYTPPEMLRAEQAGTAPDLTKASDVWQLGVLFSRICTGSWPYPTNHWHEFERFAVRGPAAAALSPGVRTLAAPLRELIVGCLDPDPAARPAIAELQRQLDTLSGGTTGSGSPRQPTATQRDPVPPSSAPPAPPPGPAPGTVAAAGALVTASRSAAQPTQQPAAQQPVQQPVQGPPVQGPAVQQPVQPTQQPVQPARPPAPEAQHPVRQPVQSGRRRAGTAPGTVAPRPVTTRPPAPRPATMTARRRPSLLVRLIRGLFSFTWRLIRTTIIVLVVLGLAFLAALIANGFDPRVLYEYLR